MLPGGALLAAVVTTIGVRAQDPDVRAPFVASPDEAVVRMLEMAGAGPGDFVMDLGSGDGRIVIAAARAFGAKGLGVDIDSRLVELSRERARNAGVADRVQFEERDVLQSDLAPATVVTIYLLPSLVDRLQPKLLAELRPGSRIVAHAFPMKGWKPDRRERIRIREPGAGQSGESELFLWIVPAQARGAWRAADWVLRVQQNFQEIDVELERDGKPIPVKQARLTGRDLEFTGPELAFRGRVLDDAIEGDLVYGGESARLEWRRAGGR